MNRSFLILVIVTLSVILTGCVESSKKYKEMQARLDTLTSVGYDQTKELDAMFAGINEIAAGLQSLREAENILVLETTGDINRNELDAKLGSIKSDINSISVAIEGYKDQISNIQKKNTLQSEEFKKLIASLNDELEKRGQRIFEINQQLIDKEKELGIKNEQIAQLNTDVDNLKEESTTQKEMIHLQDQSINTVYYLLGTRKDLREADVITRQGIFSPPIVSSQAQNANFVDIDMRDTKSIPLNTKKAKVLSVHPEDSYTIDTMDNGMQVLNIVSPERFWKQTKYLVVMITT